MKKRKLEVSEIQAVDWQTKVWYEHSAIPVPFVADRDELYIEVSSSSHLPAAVTRHHHLAAPFSREICSRGVSN